MAFTKRIKLDALIIAAVEELKRTITENMAYKAPEGRDANRIEMICGIIMASNCDADDKKRLCGFLRSFESAVLDEYKAEEKRKQEEVYHRPVRSQ